MFEKEAEELFNNKPLGYEMKPELEIYKENAELKEDNDAIINTIKEIQG